MEEVREKLMKKLNLINHPQWDLFCQSPDYDKSYKMLKTVMASCEKTF